MNKLKTIRKEKKLTQKELAEKAGISLSAYQYYERDERTPTLETIFRLSKILEVPIKTILDEFDNDDNSRFDFVASEKDIEDMDRMLIESAVYSEISWLNNSGKKEAVHLLKQLKHIPEYNINYEEMLKHNKNNPEYKFPDDK